MFTILCSFVLFRNMEELLAQSHSGFVEERLMPDFNYSTGSSVDLNKYRAWFSHYGSMVPGNLTDCDLEQEMQKVKVFWDLFPFTLLSLFATREN